MLKNSVKTIDINNAKDVMREKGWEFSKIRMLSNNEADYYLMVTLCYIPKKDEWAVHLYNNQLNGLYEGYYTKDKEQAEVKYLNKK